MQKDEAIRIYETAILRNGEMRIRNYSDDSKKKYATYVVRYAIESVLGWSPRDAYYHITYDLIVQLRLDELLDDHYIDVPKDVDIMQDPEYIVVFAYHDRGIKFNWRRQTLRVYQRILDGEITSFPKRLFDGELGDAKACFLLQYVLDQEMPEATPEELYQLFGKYSKGCSFLRKHHLYGVIYKGMYQTPLEYLHYSLPAHNRSPFLFSFWEYQDAISQVKA